MSLLDDRAELSKLDLQNLLGSIEHLPQQLEHAWEDIQKLDIKPLEQKPKNIIMFGMGGSALGAFIIKELYAKTLDISIEVINDYHLPAYATNESLVVLSSYSGTTEEVLHAGSEAIERRCQITAIASGSKLIDLARANYWSYYQIDAVHNPSNQPRMAVGYSVFGQLGLMSKLGVIDLGHDQVSQVTTLLKSRNDNLAPDSINDNQAKVLANLCVDKHLVLTGAEHLKPGMHVFNNQLNENSKHLTTELRIPELNHHYLEALSHPAGSDKNHLFVFVQSDLFDQRVNKRIELTEAIVREKGFGTYVIRVTSGNRLEQVFELMQVGAYTSYYLAMLHGIDPAPIPNVDKFKSLM